MNQPEPHDVPANLGAARERREKAQGEYRPTREEKLKNDGEPYAQTKWIVHFPPVPDSAPEILRWLTGVLMLSHDLPVVRVVRSGEYGPEGIITLHRNEADEIAVPCKLLSSPAGLISTLNTYMVRDDLTPFPYTDANCAEIWRAVRLVEERQSKSPAEQGRDVIAAYMHEASAVPGRTIEGTSVERYQAIGDLRRNTGMSDEPPTFLVDSATRRVVARAMDLGLYERAVLGGTSRGSLDRVLEAAGWAKREIQGWERPRPDRGRHARSIVWVGELQFNDE